MGFGPARRPGLPHDCPHSGRRARFGRTLLTWVKV